jgi:hypothetical protein
MGTLPIHAPDRLIALGADTTARYTGKFGRNSDVDAASSPEDVWNGGGLYTGFDPTGAETLVVTSASDDDDADGSGLRTLTLQGLDAAGEVVQETVSMNGTSGVTTSAAFYRMNRAFGVTGGAGQTNAGAITVAQSSSSDVMAVIPAGYSQTQIACATCLGGYTGLITHIRAAMSNNAGPAQAQEEAEIQLVTRDPGSSIWRVQRSLLVGSAFAAEDVIQGGIRVNALADIAMRVSDATANDLTIVARFELFMFPGTYPSG